MTRRAREASDRLTHALITMASQGLRPTAPTPNPTGCGCPSMLRRGS